MPADKLPEFYSTLGEVTQNQWCDVSKFVRTEIRDVINAQTDMTSCDDMSDSVSHPPIREKNETSVGGGVNDEMIRQSAAVHLLDSYRMFISTVILVCYYTTALYMTERPLLHM